MRQKTKRWNQLTKETEKTSKDYLRSQSRKESHKPILKKAEKCDQMNVEMN
jgi:hypothetical protein